MEMLTGSKRVILTKDGESMEFRSAREACKHIGKCCHAIWRAVKSNKKYAVTPQNTSKKEGVLSATGQKQA